MSDKSKIISYKNLLDKLDEKFNESLNNPNKIFTPKEDRLWMKLCRWFSQDDEE